MRLHNLKPNHGAKHRRKIVGRGESSGRGKTSGRGGKGQSARSGSSIRATFEGGQMPLHRRLPKRGFKNINRIDYKVFNIGQIDDLATRYELQEISPESLYVTGLLNRTDLVKILGKGMDGEGSQKLYRCPAEKMAAVE